LTGVAQSAEARREALLWITGVWLASRAQKDRRAAVAVVACTVSGVALFGFGRRVVNAKILRGALSSFSNLCGDAVAQMVFLDNGRRARAVADTHLVFVDTRLSLCSLTRIKSESNVRLSRWDSMK